MSLLLFRIVAASILWSYLLPSTAAAQQALVIQALAERKVTELPAGELFWRIENFSSRADAQAAAGPWSLVAETAGKVWLFTLGSASESSATGRKVSVVGPIPRITASQYLLRINAAIGPPGGIMVVKAGQPETGHGAGMAMQVSSGGSTDLHALVMFVVDADKPFSSSASFP